MIHTQALDCWPGTRMPISKNNGFVLGYKDMPWWHSLGGKVVKTPAPKAKGGFGANNGTIPGMRDKA